MNNITLNHLTEDFQLELPSGKLTNIMYWNEFLEYCLNELNISIPGNSKLDEIQSFLPSNHKLIISDRLLNESIESFVRYFQERDNYLNNIYNILKLDYITEEKIKEIYKSTEKYIQIVLEELSKEAELDNLNEDDVISDIKNLCLEELSNRLTNKSLENILDLSDKEIQNAIQEFSKGAYNFYRELLK